MISSKSIAFTVPGILAISLLMPVAVLTQDVSRSISLQEAIRQLEDNNPILASVRSRILSAEAYARQASMMPNPDLQVTHERLKLGAADISETYVNMSQRLEWPGTRSSRMQVRSFETDMARAGFQNAYLQLACEVSTTYVAAVAAEKHIQVLKEAADVIRQAERSGSARTGEGDLSGTDRRRLTLERVQYDELLAERGLEVSRFHRHLAQLIEPEGGLSSVRTTELPESIPDPSSLRDALAQGKINRPEMIFAASELEASEARIQLSQMERKPDLTFTLGYKNQSDSFRGTYAGLALPLAVFDRRKGEIEARQAEASESKARQAQSLREVETQIQNAHEALLSRKERLHAFQDGIHEDLSTLLESAQLSYELGEISLLELIDAASAWLNARLMLIDLQSACYTAHFDLQCAMGVLPMATPETGGEGS